MPRILVNDAQQRSLVFELSPDRPISIGRAKSSDISLDDPSVSRLHAVIRSTIGGEWQVVDRGSSNGIKVNGVLRKEAVLRPDDELTIGIYGLKFEDSQERKPTSYGTVKLPKRVTEALNQQPLYSGLSANVQALAANDARESSHLHEKRLLSLLNRVKAGLAELKNIEKVTQRTLDYALEIEGVERGFVMLLSGASVKMDPQKSEYAFAPANIRYRRSHAGEQPRAFPQLSISRSIIRQVMQLGLPMLISDGQADPRFSATKSVANAGIQSAMCAPLGMGERVRGLLYADNLSRKGMFTVDDLNAFAVIAVQSGLAVERVREKALPRDQEQQR